METIFATAFGRVIDLQRGHSDQLTEAAATLFSANEEGKKTSLSFLTTILSKSMSHNSIFTIIQCLCHNRQLSSGEVLLSIYD